MLRRIKDARRRKRQRACTAARPPGGCANLLAIPAPSAKASGPRPAIGPGTAWPVAVPQEPVPLPGVLGDGLRSGGFIGKARESNERAERGELSVEAGQRCLVEPPQPLA